MIFQHTDLPLLSSQAKLGLYYRCDHSHDRIDKPTEVTAFVHKRTGNPQNSLISPAKKQGKW